MLHNCGLELLSEKPNLLKQVLQSRLRFYLKATTRLARGNHVKGHLLPIDMSVLKKKKLSFSLESEVSFSLVSSSGGRSGPT